MTVCGGGGVVQGTNSMPCMPAPALPQHCGLCDGCPIACSMVLKMWTKRPSCCCCPSPADVHHHYTAHLDAAQLEAAAEAVGWLVESYRQLDDTSRPPDLARLRLWRVWRQRRRAAGPAVSMRCALVVCVHGWPRRSL